MSPVGGGNPSKIARKAAQAAIIGLMAGIAPAQDPPAPAPGEPSPAQPIPQTVPAEQLEAVQAELEVVTAQLVEAYRRLFLSLAEADRSAFLADMMSRGLADDAEQQDERAPLPVKVRELAYDLATAEVVSARPLGPALIDAASLGLADRQPEIRAKAAGLLAKLDASAVIERVRAALASETHTGAATQMLSVVARHPEAASQPVVLAWLKKPDLPIAVRLAALDAVLSHQRDFALTDPESLALVSATIDGLSPDEYTANTVRLLMAIGSTERVRELLGAEREVIAAAAASQLVDDAASLDAMLARAAEEPAIFAFAVEAVRRHQPTATGFRRASELPAPSPEKRAEVLTDLASSLPPSELLTVARLPMDLAERERYLSTVAAPEELQRFVDPEHRTEDRRLLLESLVRTRLQLKNAAGALRVIQGLPAEA